MYVCLCRTCYVIFCIHLVHMMCATPYTISTGTKLAKELLFMFTRIISNFSEGNEYTPVESHCKMHFRLFIIAKWHVKGQLFRLAGYGFKRKVYKGINRCRLRTKWLMHITLNNKHIKGDEDGLYYGWTPSMASRGFPLTTSSTHLRTYD